MIIKDLDFDSVNTLSILAKEIWHECYAELLSYNQIEYMTDLFLSNDSIKESINKGYRYRLVYDDNNIIGFTSSLKEEKRTFLSKLYLKKEYRHKGYSKSMIEDVHALYNQDSIYLTVNKHNNAFNIYKHLGFNVIDECVTDIGHGYVMDDYIMEKIYHQ